MKINIRFEPSYCYHDMPAINLWIKCLLINLSWEYKATTIHFPWLLPKCYYKKIFMRVMIVFSCLLLLVEDKHDKHRRTPYYGWYLNWNLQICGQITHPLDHDTSNSMHHNLSLSLSKSISEKLHPWIKHRKGK